MNKNLRNLGLAVAVSALVALTGGSLALAQSPSTTPETEATTPDTGWSRGMRGMAGRGGMRGLGSDVQRAAIAEALGITVDELETELQAGKTLADLAEEKGVDLQALYDAAEQARAASRLESIEEQVASGDLTQDKADWLLEGQEQGFSPNVLGRSAARGESTAVREALAEALGLTADELRLQTWGGRNLEALAERAGVTVEEVEAAVEAARDAALRTRIADALTAGDITQAEADWLIEGLDNGYIGQDGPMGRGLSEQPAGMGRGGRGRGGMGMSGTRGGTGDCVSDSAESGTAA